jgi:hypothetical protein
VTATATRKTPRRRDTSGHGRIRHASDLLPRRTDEFIAPWLIGAGVVPAAGIAGHLFWGSGTAQAIAPLAILGAGAALSSLAWWDTRPKDTDASSPRRTPIRARLVGSIAGAFTEIAGTTAFGYADLHAALEPHPALGIDVVRPWADACIIGTVMTCLAWNLLRTDAERGYGDDHHEQAPAPKTEDTFARKLGIDGASIDVITETADGGRRVFEITHPGHTLDVVQRAAAKLETFLRCLPGGVTVTPTSHAGVSRLSVTYRDYLGEKRDWPGLSAPGASIAVPRTFGWYADDSPLTYSPVGSAATGVPAGALALQGAPGSGKTETWLMWMLEAASAPDVVLWMVDAAKAGQTAALYRPAVDWLERDLTGAKRMVRALQRIITYRADEMGRNGFTQWTPETYTKLGIPLLIVTFEEAAQVLLDLGESAVRLVETARSCGIILVFSMQRLSGTNIPTDLRNLILSGICARVAKAVDATMCLSEDLINAGATPEGFPKDKPGQVFCEFPHTGIERDVIPARSYFLNPGHYRSSIAEWAPRMARLDRGSAAAAGTAWAERETVSVSDWLADKTAEAAYGVVGDYPHRDGVETLRPRPVSVPSPRDDTHRDGDWPIYETPTVRLHPGDDDTETTIRLHPGDDDRDEDRPTEDEMRDVRRTTLDGLDVSQETKTALAGIDPRRPMFVPQEGPAAEASWGIDETGPSDPAARDRIWRNIITDLLGDAKRPVTVKVSILVKRWCDAGFDPSKRPAMTRRLNGLIDAGGAEHIPGQRGAYRLLPEALDLLGSPEGDLDDDEDDLDDDE